jgi:hypothetical protein
MIQEAIVTFFNKKDSKKANDLVSDLTSRYPDDKNVNYIKRHIERDENDNSFSKASENAPQAANKDSIVIEKNNTGLLQNYPNPFNPSTIIDYQIPVSGHVSLKIYDVLGREVRNLVDEVKPAGHYTIQFDGSKLASGIYYCLLTISPSNGEKSITQQRRMQLLK